MKYATSSFILLLLSSFLIFSCSSNEDDQECYRCTHMNTPQTICDSELVYELCIIGPYQNTQLLNLEITEKCNGQINSTRQEIGLLQEFLEEQQAAGALCEEF